MDYHFLQHLKNIAGFEQYKLTGVFSALICSLGLGLAVALGRLAFDGGTTPLSVAFFRSLLSVVAMGTICICMGISLKLPRTVLISMLFLGCLFSHMTFGNVGSTKYIPISLAALLFFIYPPVVAILNHVIAKKWPSLIKTISITVAFLGLAVMLGVDLNQIDLRGVVIGITAGIACAVNIIWVARKVSGVHPFVIVFYQSAIASLIIGVLAWYLDELRLPNEIGGWLGFLLVGVLQTVSIPFFYFAIQRIGSEPTAMINNSQPIASIVAAILIFNEGLTLERFFGAIMVIGGILVTQWDDLKSTQNKLP
ncbi:MAG: DMT family transporter [Pseudomonadota bacterium]|nr:DMT family transporter [Pseudomonadota bacterium]